MARQLQADLSIALPSLLKRAPAPQDRRPASLLAAPGARRFASNASSMALHQTVTLRCEGLHWKPMAESFMSTPRTSRPHFPKASFLSAMLDSPRSARIKRATHCIACSTVSGLRTKGAHAEGLTLSTLSLSGANMSSTYLDKAILRKSLIM